MYEISGTSFRRGIFEIRSERVFPSLIKFLFKMGPLQLRLFAVLLLLFSLYLGMNPALGRFAIEQGWVSSDVEAMNFSRNIAQWIMIPTAIFYFFIFLFRKSSLDLFFDRSTQEWGFFYTPAFRFASLHEYKGRVDEISEIKLHDPVQAKKTPHGYFSLNFKENKIGKFSEKIKIAFLSEEQKEFFPKNIHDLSDLPVISASGTAVDYDS